MKRSVAISNHVSIPWSEIEISAVRAGGAGGQHVNKVSTAVHLRFAILPSSLPDFYKERLVQLHDQRISKDGVVVIKAQQHRSRELNLEEAVGRLVELIKGVGLVPKKRRPSRPTRGATKRRLDRKDKRGRLKALRRKVGEGN